MSDLMRYKGYYTKVVYSEKDETLIGRIEDIQDKVMFDADNLDEFRNAFHESVDDYIEICEQLGKEPQGAYSGDFNIDIPTIIQKRIAALKALDKRGRRNRAIEKARAEYVHDETSRGKPSREMIIPAHAIYKQKKEKELKKKAARAKKIQ